jgi:nucleotide-binding universal stress UspA family protein
MWWKPVVMSEAQGFKKILLATDGSEESEAALCVAINLAHAAAARVLIAHVWNLQLHHRHGSWDVEVRSEARRLVDSAVGKLQAAGVIAESKILRADNDRVAATIAVAAREFGADLVVVGSRGLSTWASMFKHSISHQLLCALDSPLLIVRDGPAGNHKSQRVLVAVAGGDDIAPSVRAAVAAAAAPGSEVLAVHDAQTIIGPQGFAFVESEEEIETTMAKVIAMIKEAGVPVEGVVAHGRPVAETIAEIAESWGADMIVVGSSRMGDIGSLVLGSVSQHLLRTTGRPVLIAERVGA